MKKSREGCASGSAGLAVVKKSGCAWGCGQEETGNRGLRVALGLSPTTSHLRDVVTCLRLHTYLARVAEADGEMLEPLDGLCPSRQWALVARDSK